MKGIFAFVALVACSFFGGTSFAAVPERPLKVLMIGNSFSICCLSHLPAVAEACGKELDLASLYIGGCSLKRHWGNAQRDGDAAFRPYRFDRVVCGVRTVSNARTNVCDALRSDKWDVVTVQQASHDSWREETYRPWGDDLVALVRRLVPGVKIVVQETWSYTPWDGRFAQWAIAPEEMYGELHKAYAAFAKRNGLRTIPFGTAVQAWRCRRPVAYAPDSIGGDVVGALKFRNKGGFDWEVKGDASHLNGTGEYLQALVWARCLLDADVSSAPARPAFVTPEDGRLMGDVAMNLGLR